MSTFVQEKKTESSVSQTPQSHTLDSPAGAGNLLVSCLGVDKSAITSVTQPSGWTMIDWQAIGATSGVGVTTAMAYKVAVGGEQTVSWALNTGRNVSIYTVEYGGVTSPSIDVSAKAGTGTTGHASQTTGTTAVTTVDDGFALAMFSGDSSSALTYASLTNGYQLRGAFNATVNTGIPPVWIAEQTVVAGTAAETTWGFGGSDETAAQIVVFADANGSPAASPAITHSRVGAVTPTSFEVVCKQNTTGVDTNIRLRVSTASDLSSPVYTSQAALNQTIFLNRATITGLSPNTQYYYGWEIDSVLMAGGRGQCKTLQSGAHSFTVCAASCSLTTSTSAVFTKIRDRNPAVYLMTGDMHYVDTNVASTASYRANWDNVMTQTVRRVLYSEIPTAYIYSDHDYCGNNTDGTATGAQYVTAAYREHMPYYTLGNATSTNGIYHTFEIGRVRFIMLDTRRHRDVTGTPTILGATQKQWLKDLTLANPKQVKIICSEVPWLGTDTDTWGGFTAERTELANYFSTNSIINILMVTGDQHSCFLDDGRNNTSGGFALFGAAPIEQQSSWKGGTYLYGPVPPNDGIPTARFHYGVLDITDTGGPTISVRCRAFDSTDTILTSSGTPLDITEVFVLGESYAPDAIISQSNLTGAVTAIDADPDDLQSISDTWLTAP